MPNICSLDFLIEMHTASIQIYALLDHFPEHVIITYAACFLTSTFRYRWILAGNKLYQWETFRGVITVILNNRDSVIVWSGHWVSSHTRIIEILTCKIFLAPRIAFGLTGLDRHFWLIHLFRWESVGNQSWFRLCWMPIPSEKDIDISTDSGRKIATERTLEWKASKYKVPVWESKSHLKARLEGDYRRLMTPKAENRVPWEGRSQTAPLLSRQVEREIKVDALWLFSLGGRDGRVIAHKTEHPLPTIG